MKCRPFLIIGLALFAVFFFGSCETTNRGDSDAELLWSAIGTPTGNGDKSNDVYLHVNGRPHAIARGVMSSDSKRDRGAAGGPDVKRLRAVSGYYLDWNVSGVTYFARIDGDRIEVFEEAWGDENEGATTIRKLKTISL